MDTISPSEGEAAGSIPAKGKKVLRRRRIHLGWGFLLGALKI